MTTPSGMIIEEVEAMAAQLSAAAEQIRQLTASLNTQVSTVTWWGDDRNRFLSDFEGQVPLLFSVADTLMGFSSRASTNAQEQRVTSGNG